MFYFSQRTLLFFVKNVSFFDLAFYLLIGSDLSSFTLPFFLLQIVFLHCEIWKLSHEGKWVRISHPNSMKNFVIRMNKQV